MSKTQQIVKNRPGEVKSEAGDQKSEVRASTLPYITTRLLASGRLKTFRVAHGSHRPSPAGGGIFEEASGKDFQAPCRSDMVAVRKDYAAPTALGRIELKFQQLESLRNIIPSDTKQTLDKFPRRILRPFRLFHFFRAFDP